MRDQDVNCMFPIERLAELYSDVVIGGVAQTHYGMMGWVPDPRSTVRDTVPEIMGRAQAEGADIILLTPGRPICHRSVGLIQNAIEERGISTVSLTAHPHITKIVGAPRAIYMRFPQGNQLGQASNSEQQRAILTTALESLRTMETPGAILEYPDR